MEKKEYSKEICEKVVACLDEDKAANIVVIDLSGKTDIADFFVVASGRSSKHISSMADSVKENLEELGLDNICIDGKVKGDWVLVDAHNVIIHLFREEIRALYEIEKLWQM